MVCKNLGIVVFKRERITYTGNSSLLSDQWVDFFTMSAIGNSHEVLWETENNYLIMTDTEYERTCHYELYNALFEGADVLSIGYGIGFILPEVRAHNCNLTVIERYQEVVDLEPEPIHDIDIIIADAYRCDYGKLFPTKRFDIVWWDCDDPQAMPGRFNTGLLNFLLKPQGKFLRWSHTE